MMKAAEKTILVFAGPNGSGKSTITSHIPNIGLYINADDIQLKHNCDNLTAAKIAENTRNYCVDNGLDFTFETVLSTDRNLQLLARARNLGYRIICIYVLTNDPAVNVRRVIARHRNNGDDVPPEKVVIRYWRCMKLIPELLSVCDRLLIFDNSAERDVGEPSLIVEMKDREIYIHPSELWNKDNIQKLLRGEYCSYK